MKQKKVYVVGSDWLIQRMFIIRGWKLTDAIFDADLLQFTGGSDVDPSYYGEERHATTYSLPKRDAYEFHLFYQHHKIIPMAGICRGGQFLNIACGGKMWQNVDFHNIGGTHKAFYKGEEVQVNSTHHQMMRPTDNAQILLTAKESSFRETATERNIENTFNDIESVYYDGCLCFQPHPEYLGGSECEELYFQFLKEYLNV